MPTGVQTLPAARVRVYYGWVVLGVAALAMVGTLPGRTQGLGLITEPLLRDLGLSRVAYAQINLVATLVGALGCFGVGRLLDRYGSRGVLTVLALLLGVVVVAMSQAAGFAVLLVFVTLTRGLGQSALSVVSLAMVGKWFRRRLTRAMAIYALVMSIGFMIAFPARRRPRAGAAAGGSPGRAIGVSLLLVLAPVAWLFDRSSPEAMGLEVDGGQPGGDELRAEPAACDAGERRCGRRRSGCSRSPAGLRAGRLRHRPVQRIDPGRARVRARRLPHRAGGDGDHRPGRQLRRRRVCRSRLAAPRPAGGALVLTGALAALAHVTTVAHVMAQAVAMGVAGGFVMVVFFSFWGRAYGRAHLGRIQGAAQALTVLASAVGPLFLACFVETTGSYAAGFYALAAVVAALAVAAMVVPIPAGAQRAARRGAVNAMRPRSLVVRGLDLLLAHEPGRGARRGHGGGRARRRAAGRRFGARQPARLVLQRLGRTDRRRRLRRTSSASARRGDRRPSGFRDAVPRGRAARHGAGLRHRSGERPARRPGARLRRRRSLLAFHGVATRAGARRTRGAGQPGAGRASSAPRPARRSWCACSGRPTSRSSRCTAARTTSAARCG